MQCLLLRFNRGSAPSSHRLPAGHSVAQATIIESVKKTNRVLCLQETWPTCGVAAEVAAVIAEQAFDYLDAPIRRLGSLDCPAPFAPELEQFVLPSTDKVVQAVREMM